jgi:pantothenate kinase-related protein Tda10
LPLYESGAAQPNRAHGARRLNDTSSLSNDDFPIGHEARRCLSHGNHKILPSVRINQARGLGGTNCLAMAARDQYQ